MLYIWILSNKFDLKQTIRVLHTNLRVENSAQTGFRFSPISFRAPRWFGLFSFANKEKNCQLP